MEATWHHRLPESYKWLQTVKVTNTTTNNIAAKKGQVIIIPVTVTDDHHQWKIAAEELPDQTANVITQTATTIGWKALNSTTIAFGEGLCLLVPIPKIKVTTAQKGRQVGLDSAASCAQYKAIETIVICGGKKAQSIDICDGFLQGIYATNSFKSNHQDKNTIQHILTTHTSNQELDELKIMAQSLMLARFIGDAPPNWLNSERFAEIASDLAQKHNLKCTIRGREEIKALGMGAFASVAEGTATDPKFIHLTIPGKDPTKTIALVGKGLTFDSGGISIKPSASMADMKYDLCGGAAVLGAANYLAQVKPCVNVVCLIGAVENMPGRQATRPGDVVTAYNNKTIEVLNTDAEGRLVLCDLLSYAVKKHEPEFIVNVATLTGAVLMALGSIGSAVMSNDDQAAQQLLKCAQASGEPMWRLPLWPELPKELKKSKVADLQNITESGVKAGTITAGCFLQEFVNDTPWAHIDIAGTGWNCKATGFPHKGGCGFSLRTLVNLCQQWEG